MATYQRLKEIRKLNKVTQAKMAEILGLTQPGYNRYECGKREPSHEMLIRIADVFNISLDYIMNRVDEPYYVVRDGDKRVLSTTQSTDGLVTSVQTPVAVTEIQGVPANRQELKKLVLSIMREALNDE